MSRPIIAPKGMTQVEIALANFKSGAYGTPENPRRGGGHRCAFWDAYEGVKRKHVRTSINEAHAKAGKLARKMVTETTLTDQIQDLGARLGGVQQLMDACCYLLLKEDFEAQRREDQEAAQTLKEYVEMELEMLYDDRREACNQVADQLERALKIGKKEKL